MKNTYVGEKFDRVVELLKQNPNLSKSNAIRMMCKEFDIVEEENAVKGVLKLLKRRKVRPEKDRKKNKKVTKVSTKLEESKDFKQAQGRKIESSKQAFIITYAQNATSVHTNLFDNILAYAKHLNAGIHVIAGRYKNPTSVWTDKQANDEQWANEVMPYLDANRHNVHEYLQILSDLKISPTASTPLSGLNSITGLESCIVGHPRQHLKSLPVLEGYPHKLLLSTGACTVPNYTDSKAGKKGEFHHMLGFALVQKSGDSFHVRQINASDDGNFYDVRSRVKDGKVSYNEEGIKAAILGDIHVRHSDAKVVKVAFDLLDELKPDVVIVHDIAEMESVLHWDEKNPFRLLEKEEDGTDDLELELKEIMAWIRKYKKYNLVISRSNHDDMLDRWLMAADWRKVKNKKMYLKLANILANHKEARTKGILPWLIDDKFPEVVTLSLDDSYRVGPWECAMHGHLGSNGSRGGHVQFKNLNTKNIVAHGHHPHREDGHIMVGTLTHLRVGFNRGPSNWMNGLSVIYPDNKAQLLHIIKGKLKI